MFSSHNPQVHSVAQLQMAHSQEFTILLAVPHDTYVLLCGTRLHCQETTGCLERYNYGYL